MGVTSDRLKELELIDEIVPEPLGGAHRDMDAMASNLKQALHDQLEQLSSVGIEELLEQRYKRLMSFGQFTSQS